MGARYRSNTDPFAGFFIVIFVFVMVFLVEEYKSKKEQERRDKIKDYCDNNGLEYSELACHIPDKVYPFSIMNSEKGHSHEYVAETSGMRGDYYFSIFEHTYVTGYGKSATYFHDTLCIISREGLDMPQFFLRDENMILDTLGKVFGGQDINFNEDPTFSKSFVLQGYCEEDVREFFNPPIRDAFVRYHLSGYKYEGKNQFFMIARTGGSDIPERLKMLSIGISIFKVLAPESDFGESLGNVI